MLLPDRPEMPSPVETPQRKAGLIKAERTRKSIIDAARIVFSERPYDSVSVSRIVEQAGVANGTFYLYFENKEAVLRDVTVSIVADYAQFMNERMKSIDDPIDRVSIATRSVLEFASADSDLGKVLVQAAINLPETRARYQRMLRLDLEQGVAKGVFKVVVDDILLNIVTVGNATVLDAVLRGAKDPEVIDRYIEYLLRLLGVPHDIATLYV
ncbi:MAG: hypothetical protein B7Y49_06915 [Sphingomonas sp. 28-62-11]|nr:MAG: hypothetical protein B7Y49_06915 [Sphingomonas sp. 28-62-11]